MAHSDAKPEMCFAGVAVRGRMVVWRVMMGAFGFEVGGYQSEHLACALQSDMCTLQVLLSGWLSSCSTVVLSREIACIGTKACHKREVHSGHMIVSLGMLAACLL